ncbi:MAG: hypothetical protein K1X86_12550 [Ignavibacteria bacterium]|nr:hypothetical protein [Ignavibacteria bacterium]
MKVLKSFETTPDAINNIMNKIRPKICSQVLGFALSKRSNVKNKIITVAARSKAIKEIKNGFTVSIYG